MPSLQLGFEGLIKWIRLIQSHFGYICSQKKQKKKTQTKQIEIDDKNNVRLVQIVKSKKEDIMNR